MNTRIRNRSIVIVLITIGAVLAFAGLPPGPAGLKKNIRLGLDLKGGTQEIGRAHV
mgnify:CR=1 FL=1